MKALTIVGVALLLVANQSSADSSFLRQEVVVLPPVDGWQIEARSSSCIATFNDGHGQKTTILANRTKYRGGVWYLSVESSNQHLKPDAYRAEARLSLDGKERIVGEVVSIGTWAGTQRDVRYEFTAIDNHIGDIEAARVIKAQAEDLSPLKLEPLKAIIAVIKKCHLQR